MIPYGFLTLTYYALAILLASVLGGMIPIWFRLTHRWMEFAVSLVAGVMLGVALLHMIPHALMEIAVTGENHLAQSYARMMTCVLIGLLVMFFIERFFCFHHHDVPDEEQTHEHVHDVTWSGAAIGLTLHSIIAGIALAASVAHGHSGTGWAGFSTFLIIVLHKPLDSMTIATLMAKGGWSLIARHLVNGLFALAVPLGMLLFNIGLLTESTKMQPLLGFALAFSAGAFLCIALSDLLPELQFHTHDRVKLSLALLLGVGISVAAGEFERRTAVHNHAPPAAVSQLPIQASELPPDSGQPAR